MQTDQQRAAERGQEMGFEGLPTDSNMLSLGMIDVVDGIVRALATEANEANLAFAKGEIDGAAALKRCESAVLKAEAIFLGKDSAYNPSWWNSVDGVGAFIAGRLDISEPKDAVRAVLWHVVATILDVHRRLTVGEISDGDAKFTVDACVEDAIALLFGANPPSEFAADRSDHPVPHIAANDRQI